MATRCRIAMERPDRKIASIYCHSDGSLPFVGLKLMNHYHSPGKAAQLMALGSLSVLGKEIGEKHREGWRERDYSVNSMLRKNRALTWSEAWEERNRLVAADKRLNWCCAHGRDFVNRPDMTGLQSAADIDDSEDALAQRFMNSDQQYLYLWRYNTWWTLDGEAFGTRWTLLFDAIKNDGSYKELLVDDRTYYALNPGPRPFVRSQCVAPASTPAPTQAVPLIVQPVAEERTPARPGRRAIVI